MASLTGQLVAETYKALLKTIDNDILTASEKQITDGLGGGSNVFIDSQGFLRANKYKVTNGLATQFLKADGSLDANTYLTSITGAQVIAALGYTPVTDQRTLTINGVTYNLTANRSWTVAGTAAIWGNITGTLSDQTDLQNALNAKFNNPTGTTAQYIRGDGTLATFPSAAVWGNITGTLADQTDLQSALNAKQNSLSGTGFVKASGATISYDNSTYLTTGDAASTYLALTGGTLSGNLVISGTNPKLFLTDTDNNPDYSIQNYNGTFKITDETNSADRFFIYSTGIGYYNGDLKANKLFVEGGLSTQFIKGDGTLDTNTYLTAASLDGYLAKSGGTMTGDLNFYTLKTTRVGGNAYIRGNWQGSYWGLGAAATGHTIIIDQVDFSTGAYESITDVNLMLGTRTVVHSGNVATYALPITGGTVTGSITATSFVKSGGLSTQFLMADGSVSTLSSPVTGSGSAGYIPKWTTAANIGSSIIYEDGTSIGIAYTTPNKGGYGRTLTGASFGSASFGFESVSNTTTNGGLIGGLSFIVNQNDSSRIVGSAIQSNLVGTTATNYGADLRFFAKADAGVLGEVARMTSAGLRVYGTIVKDGGTASQFLMADGSVTTLSGVVTGSGTTNYLPKWTSGSAIGNSIISDNGTNVAVAGNLQSARFYNTFVNAGNNSRNSFQSFNLNETSLTAGWIAADFGDLGTTSNRVVFGSGYGGKAIIGGHTGLLDNWASLLINPYGSGNVIIGASTDAGYKFDVNGTGRFSSSLTANGGFFNGNGSFTNNGFWGTLLTAGTGSYSDFAIIDNTSTQIMRVPTGTRNVVFSGSVSVTSLGSTGQISISNGVDTDLLINVTAAGATTKYSSIQSSVSGRNLTLNPTNGGNIGIATTNPGERFEVNGSIKATGRTVLATSIGGVSLSYESSVGYLETWNSSALVVRTYNYQSFNISGTQALKINTNRNILINTDTDTGYNLYVNGQIAMDTGSFKGILGSIQASWGGGTSYPTLYGSSNDRWVMYINPHVSYTQNGVNGFTGSMTGATLRMASDPAATNYWDVGIGVCSVGSDKFAIGRNATALFTITNTGNVTATAFFESSDIRLKTLIENNPIIDGIEKLEAKLYKKNGKIELGYFAQDAELIMPHAVQKSTDGFLNLSYREVHTAKIARLEHRVAELEKQLNAA